MKIGIADFFKKTGVLLSEAFGSFRRNNDLTSASSLAFSAMLALIPALFLFTSVLSNVVGSSQEALGRTGELLVKIMPTYSKDILKEVSVIASHKRTIGVLNAAVLLWMISPLVSEMRSTLGIIFRKRPKRHFLLQKLLDLSITALYLLGLAVVALAGVMAAVLKQAEHQRLIPGYIEGPATFLVVTAAVYLLYFTFSSRVRAKYLLAGALVTSVLWSLMRPAFTMFLTYNPGYGVAFGSFKSLFVVIIWIYYSLIVFLFGAEVAANLQRKEAVFIKRLMEGRRGIPAMIRRKFITTFGAGDVIFNEGDAGDNMYSIRRGRVSIRKGHKEIAVVEEGGFFGEMSFLLQNPRSATAVALEDTELITISNENVGLLMNEFPEFAVDMLRVIAARLRDTNCQIG